MNSSSSVTPEEISQRAHDIWEQSGRPEGRETEHWLRAERELQNERRHAETLARSSRSPKGSREVTRAQSAIR